MYASPNITRVMKVRWMRWGHVECMEEIRNAYKIFVGKPEGKMTYRMTKEQMGR
jgi:hypothetical protein